jgi:hypothetical protein
MRINTPWDFERLHFDADYFLDCVWAEMRLPPNALTEYERMMFRFGVCGPSRRMVMGFRQIGKTTLVTGPLCLYRLRRDVNREILISSKNDREVNKLLRFVRQGLNLTFMRDLAPDKKDLDNRTAFNVRGKAFGKQPSVSVGSIQSALEGGRANTVIGDDIETKENALTPDGRERLHRQMDEFTNIIYTNADMGEYNPVDPNEIVFCQTPKHEDSIASKLKKEGFAVRSYPLALPRDGEPEPFYMDPGITAYAQAHGIKPGESLAPLRFPTTGKEFLERRAKGKHEFYREQQCVVYLLDKLGYPLKLSDLIVMELSPPPAKLPASVTYGISNHNGSTASNISTIGVGQEQLYRPAFIDEKVVSPTRVHASIDPSGIGKDKMGVAIGADVGGFIYVYRVEGLPGGFDEASCENIVLLLKQYRVRTVFIETNMDTAGIFRQNMAKMISRHVVATGDASFPDGWSCKIEGVHNTVRKEHRIIDVLDAVMTPHRLVMDPCCLRAKIVGQDDDIELKNELQHQIANITRDKGCLREDGKIDALAMLVESFKSALRPETTKARERALDREAKKQREFMDRQTRKMLGIKEPVNPYSTWR